MNEEPPVPDYGGYSAVPRKIVYDQTISGHAKLVYMCLGARINADYRAWPSHALMAKEAGLGVTSVKKALAELKALGLVDWSKRIMPDGSQTSNIYVVNVQMPSTKPPADGGPPF